MTLTEFGSILASPLASNPTLKSKGDATLESAIGEFNLIVGPREIPLVDKGPEIGGKAASLALIKGVA
jgi:hypothetical protein